MKFRPKISQRKPAAIALSESESEERYRELFENSKEIIYVHDLDGRFTSVNKATEKLFGYKRDEILGKNIADFLAPHYIEPVREKIRQKLADQSETTYEIEVIAKDGRSVPIEVSSRLIYENGVPVGVQGTARDITERKGAEEALQKSQVRFQSLLQSLDGIVWEADANTFQFSFVSEPAQRLLGYPLEQWIKEPTFWKSHIHPDDQMYAVNYCVEATREMRPHEFEYRMIAADGRIVWLRDIVTVVVEGNKPKSLRGIMVDITERRQTEKALRESEERYRELFEQASDIIYTIDNRGKWLAFNPAALRLLKYSEQELGGQNQTGLVRSDYREAFKEFYRAQYVGRVPNTFYSFPVIAKDGTEIWIEQSGTLVFENDRVAGFHFVARDITARKRAEDAARVMSERFGAVLRAATASSIIGTDPSGVITVFNEGAERMLGYGAGEAIGKATMETIHDADEVAQRAAELGIEPGFEVFVAAARKGEADTREWTYIRKDGSRLSVSLTVTAMRGEGGELLGFIGIGSDITERKRIEADLKLARDVAIESARIKSEFLANTSHEIRTPMNGILGMTELALETDLSSEQREYLDIVKSSTHSLLTIINDILDFSKIEAGKLDLDTVDFSLQEAIAGATRTIALRAHEKGLELAFEVSEDVPDALLGDPGRLRQLVLNLAGNAVKFTEAGEVLVRIERAGGADKDVVLHFSVSDTGIGIPADKQKLIFQAFAQADGSTTRTYGGTGLGLAICSQLVEMMGGRIWVESEEGKGSTFHFTARFGLQPEIRSLVRHEPANLQGVRALIVDDNDTNRRILLELLKRWQMKPTAVESGEQALAALKHGSRNGEAFTLVLLDACMPGMDGFAVAEQIRDSEASAGTTIMMLTSIDQQVSMARIRDLGLTSYLVKPVSQSDLFNAIQTALCAPQQSIVPPVAPEANELTMQSKSLRFLLAEDNDVNQKLAVWLLEKRGHSVAVAANGQEALDAIEKEQFDVVLMDVQMPKMNGLEATKIIRQSEKATGAHTSVIAMTALAMKGDRERCLAAGMDDYISKPIKANQLFQTIDRLLSVKADHAFEAHHENHRKAADSAMPGPAFDEAELLLRVEGSVELIQQLTAIFQEEWPPLLVEMCAAIDHGDAGGLDRVSHRIKGSAGIFGANTVVQAAQRLEDMGRADDLNGAVEESANLERELKRLQEALNGYLQTA